MGQPISAIHARSVMTERPKELNFGEAEDIGGRMWYPVKTHTIALSVESNTPSHSVYE